jgi:hypothetical protein
MLEVFILTLILLRSSGRAECLNCTSLRTQLTTVYGEDFLLISSLADFNYRYWYQRAPRLNTTYHEDYLRLRLRTTISLFSTEPLLKQL